MIDSDRSNDQLITLRRRGVLIDSIHTAHDQPTHDVEQASELSFDDILKHLLIQTQVRNNRLQTTILVLKLLQSAHLVRQHPAIFFLPIEKRGLDNTCFPAHLSNRDTILRLFQHERFLGVRKFRCLHTNPSVHGEESLSKGCRAPTG